MKKIYLVILLIVGITTTIFGQSQKQIAQLGDLAKVWGLLKYYHPAVAGGKHDWDSALVTSLTAILANGRENHASAAIDRLLAIPGPDTAALYVPHVTQSVEYSNYNVSWIWRSKYLNEMQKEKLQYIVSHPNRSGNIYALHDGEDSTVSTPGEKLYKEMELPNASFRLLALFRFWNVINYYYPYKYVIGKPWEHVLQELIPVMVKANNISSYHRAIARMAASINDSHGGLWPEVYNSISGKYSPGFNFHLIDGKAVVTKITDTALLRYPQFQVGSVLTSIDGVAISKLIRRYWKYVPGSNPGGKIKTLHSFVLNTFAGSAEYRGVNRDGKKIQLNLPQSERNFLKTYLEFFEMKSADTAKILPGNIGYVYFSNLNSKNLHQTMRSLMQTRAIIFDMRNYPENGAGTYWVPDYLIGEPKKYATTTHPDFSLPGRFKLTNANAGTDFSTVGGQKMAEYAQHYQGKIILLVDSRTQSAAEWACMTLMTANNVTVIGNQTAGADGNVTRTVLPGGFKIAFSGLGIYFPDGSATQRSGIPIDISVHYTVSDIINRHDPLLEKALEFLKNQKY